ncbi:hypothetical protein AWB79_07513 [Caballeronia hypogeia]|uniref:Uncharacterized protein n=1 Tax=Caballeronia hypogeia TaxID=1777140 RepID=A0A158DT05_9BURK|nr:hypothetical protein AWB79_07513 [Caballeronia hypogeia]
MNNVAIYPHPPSRKRGAFTHEDSRINIDAEGKRV